MRNLELKGANAVQLLGGVETYLRRYLYMTVLDIVEADQFDNMPSPDLRKPSKAAQAAPIQPSSAEFVDEVGKIVSSLTPDQKKSAGEIVKSLNNGSANIREITDVQLQAKILEALRRNFV